MYFYETEEEQVAALKAWWKENGQAVLIGLGIGIAGILAWNAWQEYRQQQAEQASALYAQLLEAQKTGAAEKVLKQASDLETQFKNSDYALLAALQAAKTKAEAGDWDAAKPYLEKVAASANKDLANIAKIRLVRLLMAKKEFEAGLKLINGIDPATISGFAGEYDELVGDLYVALDRPDQARTSYESAVRNGQQSPFLQMKMDDLTAPEKVEAKP